MFNIIESLISVYIGLQVGTFAAFTAQEQELVWLDEQRQLVHNPKILSGPTWYEAIIVTRRTIG